MANNLNFDVIEFMEYMRSILQLNALDNMTEDLDEELLESQNVMAEIKAIYDIASTVQNSTSVPVSDEPRHDNISKFLESSGPRLPLPDATENNMNMDAVDIDAVIATLKTYAESFKKNFTEAPVQAQSQAPKPKEFVQLELEQYAQSLDQLCKRVANIKLNQKDELNNRNVELEVKLTILCEDINKFTTMVHAKTALSESNRNWQATDTNALQYDNIINKLLSGINEVTYLLQNKN